MNRTISVVIPAKDEAASLPSLLVEIKQLLPSAELIVVDDGSGDQTSAVAQQAGARVVRHRYSMGNGAAIKTGARAATGEIIVFMDADGQHDPADIPRLLEKFDEGYDLVVGARNRESQASFMRMFGNGIYNRLASWMVGHSIADLTSGFRVARASVFREFLYLLPNGFSYPTTSTMAFFRAGHAVGYVAIRARKRESSVSHVRLLRDGTRFFLIIFRVATLYSPLKVFLPISFSFFALGAAYYAYTFISSGRFTNFSALLFSSAVIIFLIGLVSEQITAQIYRQ